MVGWKAGDCQWRGSDKSRQTRVGIVATAFLGDNSIIATTTLCSLVKMLIGLCGGKSLVLVHCRSF